MPSFSRSSREKLLTCDHRIQKVMNEVIKHFDCKILVGHRTKEEQQEAYDGGFSKVQFPHSKHNSQPSRAVDVAPYPVNWNDIDRFYFFAGYVMGIADLMGIRLRWGGDWDMDTQVNDQTFFDLAHFELVD